MRWNFLRDERAIDWMRLVPPLPLGLNIKVARFACVVFMVLLGVVPCFGDYGGGSSTVGDNVWQPVIHLFFKDYFGNPVDVEGVEVSVTGFSEPIIVNGSYDLVVPYGWSGTITPSKDDTIFVPTSKSYENITQENINVSFSLHPYSGGAGTEKDPYLISDADDLRTLADDPHNSDKNFIMTNDIDMGDPNVVNMKTISSRYPTGVPFFGVFDGQGFSIKDVRISEYGSSGLFGEVGTNNGSLFGSAMIRNLVVISPAVGKRQPASSCFLIEIVGHKATIENCKVEGGRIDGEGSLAEINYGTIKNCYAIDINVEGYQPGGLVGSNYGVISNCSVSGTVIGDYYAGGLVGWSGNERAVVEDCSANCSVQGYQSVGGLIGMNKAGVFNSFAVGNVTGYDNVGGFVGANYSDVSECYSTVSVSGNDFIGGLVGKNYGTIDGSHASGRVVGNLNVGGLAGENQGLDWPEEVMTGLIVNSYATGKVIGYRCVGGLVGLNRREVYVDPFPLEEPSKIVNCYARGDVEAEIGTGGGLVGENMGQIERCWADGEIKGKGAIGGLVGFNKGDIKRSFAKGDVVGWNLPTYFFGGLVGWCLGGSISDCYAWGNVSGRDVVGGLVGETEDAVTDRCYSVGLVVDELGGGGGFVAWGDDNRYSGCFWDVTVNPGLDGIGNDSDPNVIGEVTENLQRQATFVDGGWDFVGESGNGMGDVWRMCVDGVGYPRLSWEFGGDFTCPDGVGVEDLVYLCERWLEDGELVGTADGDGDGSVGFEDFGVMAEGWLE